MTEKQVFGVIIRGLGVYFSTLGVQQIYSLTFLAFSKFANEQGRYNIMDVFSVGLIWFVVSYVLIRKPDLIVDFAYERQSEPDLPPN
jgi:hypothetical protein